MRLIYEEDVKKEIDEWLDAVGEAFVRKGVSYYGELMGCIEDAPTVEAKEVVHAKWIDGCCSNCGAYIPTDSLWDYISEKECNFCYFCGCDMRTSAE